MRKLGVKELKELRDGDASLLEYIVGLLQVTPVATAAVHILDNFNDGNISGDLAVSIVTKMADHFLG